jgi:hypothetical protein
MCHNPQPSVKASLHTSGLPDGLFSNPKFPFGLILEGLTLENVDKFYGHLEYFTYRHLGYFMTIWQILCSFGTFFLVWYNVRRKIWQPWFSLHDVKMTETWNPIFKASQTSTSACFVCHVMFGASLLIGKAEH